jgi:hypothetical protein
MSMEEEFDIDISDEDAEKLVTVKDAYRVHPGPLDPLGRPSKRYGRGLPATAATPLCRPLAGQHPAGRETFSMDDIIMVLDGGVTRRCFWKDG